MNMYSEQLLGEVGYYPLAVPRHNGLAETLLFVDRDFTGSTFSAHIRTEPEANGAPLASPVVTFVSVSSAKTWQNLIDECLIGINQVPCGKLVTAAVPVSTVTVLANKAVIEALPYPADRRDNIILYWDLMMLTPSVQTILAGEFTVIAGVTR